MLRLFYHHALSNCISVNYFKKFIETKIAAFILVDRVKAIFVCFFVPLSFWISLSEHFLKEASALVYVEISVSILISLTNHKLDDLL